MKKIISICFVLMFFARIYAQNVTILPNGITPATSDSYLRLTYDEIMTLPSPKEGDLVFDLTYKCLRVFSEGKWICSYKDPLNYSPELVPIMTAGGVRGDSGNAIAVDDSGNVYITGQFNSFAIFGSTNRLSTSNGGNMFVAKYSKTGILKWLQTAGGPIDGYVGGSEILVDSKGNVYVMGGFIDEATFGTITVSTGSSFLAKYNCNGGIEWVKAEEGLYFRAITVDNDNNLYIAGSYFGTQTFGTTTITSQWEGWNTTYQDIFMAKYDTMEDNWISAQSIGGTGIDQSTDIVLDSTGNVYLLGTYSGTVAFGSITKTSEGNTNYFVGKYNPLASDWEWVLSTRIAISKIVADNDGNVYLTGHFLHSTITLGTMTKFLKAPNNTTSGNNIFAAKLDTNGIVQWIETAGGPNTDEGIAIAVDANSNVYVTGFYSGTVYFGSTTITTTGISDIFIAKYNSIGGLMWVQSIDGQTSNVGNSLAVDPSGYMYVAGNYNGTATFGRTTMTSVGSTDIFIAKMD